MGRIQHRVGVKTTLRAAFEALHHPEGLTGWWATTASGTPELGGRLTLGFPGYPDHVWEITELREDQRLTLQLRSGPGPWSGSILGFELAAGPGQVFVTLIHETPADVPPEAFQYFNTKWPTFLVSLKALLETGRGRPYPHDIKIQHD